MDLSVKEKIDFRAMVSITKLVKKNNQLFVSLNAKQSERVRDLITDAYQSGAKDAVEVLRKRE